MNLSLDQIKQIVKGAVRVEEENGEIACYRFTKPQMEYYHGVSDNFWQKTHISTGVRLEFETDSDLLKLKFHVKSAASTMTFHHDIYINGDLQHTIGGNLNDYPNKECFLEGTYHIGKGKKQIKIYFPWCVISRIVSVEVDDNAVLVPLTHHQKWLVYGDSIANGACSDNPSLSVISRLTDDFDAETVNKAISGEMFCPDLPAIPEEIFPDRIFVAYGTNDWANRTKESFENACLQFFENVRKHFPTIEIIALAPVWRQSNRDCTAVGEFSSIYSFLVSVSEKIPQMKVIDCYTFIPHDPVFYFDGLHPNNEGFSFYEKNLKKVLTMVLS